MTIQITGTVEPTNNSKYQKVQSRGEPIYSVGLQGQADLVGKTVTVTVEVAE